MGASPALPQPSWLSGTSGRWTLSIRVQPGASRSECVGVHDGCLKLRVAAPPVDGRANDALRAFLAARLDVPRSAIEVEQGTTSRRKRVRIACTHAAAELATRLAPAR